MAHQGLEGRQINAVVHERYVIEHKVGQGGMGVVFRATDVALERPVALKMLAEELSQNPEALHVFEEEARVLARLRHRNIVPVYDVFREDERSFLVMEFVEGTPVDQLVERYAHEFPVTLATDILLQLFAVLGHLHSQGVVHRDIKPSNLILEPDGTLRLMDFGLAREVSRVLQKGTRIRGTPAYMAPEHLRGLELTAASDLYSAGVTAFELFTGQLPFDGDEMAYEHILEPPKDPREFRPALPMPWVEVIAACLEKSPDDRPESGTAVLRWLIEQLGERERPYPPSVMSELEVRASLSQSMLSALNLTKARTTPTPLSELSALSAPVLTTVSGTFADAPPMQLGASSPTAYDAPPASLLDPSAPPQHDATVVAEHTPDPSAPISETFPIPATQRDKTPSGSKRGFIVIVGIALALTALVAVAVIALTGSDAPSPPTTAAPAPTEPAQPTPEPPAPSSETPEDTAHTRADRQDDPAPAPPRDTPTDDAPAAAAAPAPTDAVAPTDNASPAPPTHGDAASAAAATPAKPPAKSTRKTTPKPRRAAKAPAPSAQDTPDAKAKPAPAPPAPPAPNAKRDASPKPAPPSSPDATKTSPAASDPPKDAQKTPPPATKPAPAAAPTPPKPAAEPKDASSHPVPFGF